MDCLQGSEFENEKTRYDDSRTYFEERPFFLEEAARLGNATTQFEVLKAHTLDEREIADQLAASLFVERLRREAKRHDDARHPFNLRLFEGRAASEEVRLWVVNQYFYRTRLPIAHALILSKSEDPAFRRRWLHHLTEQDGERSDEGALALWERLAEAVGADRSMVESAVLPGVRCACDAYLTLVRDASLNEAVAASLSEAIVLEPMERRLALLEHHYPWIDARVLAALRARVRRTRPSCDEALTELASLAPSSGEREACVRALVRKAQILWHVLDCLEARTRSSAR
jgi:pyrroloquinoline-quinone synthase